MPRNWSPVITEQLLTRSLIDVWLRDRIVWLSLHVEGPQRLVVESSRRGVCYTEWNGEVVHPTPRRYSVRMRDWANAERGRTGRPINMSTLMRVAYGQPTKKQVEDSVWDVRNWRHTRMALGPFLQPDSQDAFNVFVVARMIDATIR